MSETTKPTMTIWNWGCSGSLPSPTVLGRYGEPDFIRTEFGGNTTSFYVEAGPFRVIMDNGSGVRRWGNWAMRRGLIGKHFINTISHLHWDHVQGGPFCTPFFIKANTFHIHGHEPPGYEKGAAGQTLEALLADQQSNPHFPVDLHSLPSKRIYHSHPRLFAETWWYYANQDGSYEIIPDMMVGADHETIGDDRRMNIRNLLKIQTVPVNHPDGCLGFVVSYMGVSFANLTDLEPQRHPSAPVVKLCRGVRVMYADGQYTEQEIAGMTQGFGHGTPRSCVEQAMAAGAEELWIGHLDPERDDAQLREMELDAQQYAREIGYTGLVRMAREGDRLEIP